MRLKLAALGALVVVAGLAMVFLVGSEESRVRARVTAAAEALSGRAGEGDLDRLARLAGFAKGLAPDVEVETGPGGPSIRGRDAVAAVASQLAAGGSPQITVSDVTVALDDSRSRATVTALVHVTSATPGPASSRDGDVVRIELVKNGDQWLIARAAPEAALAR
ncbi:MAG: nuclear transport factor 2 family protein [Vicinamibacteraceae bacterium]